MGFNRRKMEDQRRDAAEKEAASRRATDAQILDAVGPAGSSLRAKQARGLATLNGYDLTGMRPQVAFLKVEPRASMSAKSTFRL